MKKVEFDSNQYDEIYASGGVEKIYEIPYHNSGYYPLFRKVHSVLTKSCIPSVLEVGCGTGGFAHLLAERSPGLRYRGFDFSGVAVQPIHRT